MKIPKNVMLGVWYVTVFTATFIIAREIYESPSVVSEGRESSMKIQELIEALEDFQMSNSTDEATEVFFEPSDEGSIILLPSEELVLDKSSNRLILTSQERTADESLQRSSPPSSGSEETAG